MGNRLVIIILFLAFHNTIFSNYEKVILDCISVKNQYNSNLNKEGVWVECNQELCKMGKYDNNEKRGVWFSFDLLNLELLDLFYYSSENDNLQTIASEKIQIEANNKILLSDSSSFRININNGISLSKLFNDLLIDVNIGTTNYLFIFKYINVNLEKNKGKLVLSSVKQMVDEKYEGVTYLFYPKTKAYVKLNYRSGWLEGWSELVLNKDTSYLYKYEKGNLKCTYEVTNLSVDKLIIHKVKRRSLFGSLNKDIVKLFDLYRYHLNCESCDKNRYEGMHGFNVNNFTKKEKLYLSTILFTEYNSLLFQVPKKIVRKNMRDVLLEIQ